MKNFNSQNMEYLIDLKFEDRMYNAIVHFVATFTVKNEYLAESFIKELDAGFKRKGVVLFPSTYYRIDNDQTLKERSYAYYQFCKNKATAFVDIEQFFLENPDQGKSLVENLTDRLFLGENSTALIGEKCKIPVRVYNKNTYNPIDAELYYFSIEHLIPTKNNKVS